VCIYCTRPLDPQEFNREHVLSEAFGEFDRALVLQQTVCRQCNQFFGDNLEVWFARGGFEGLLRYQKGVRTPPAGTVHLRYVEFAVPEGNDWAGVRLSLTNNDLGLCFRVVPQAAFFDEIERRWVYATAAEIDAGLLARRPDYKKGQIRVYAPSQEEHDAMVAKLGEHGVNFRRSGELLPPEGLFGVPGTPVEVAFTINQGIRRCIAKYAFNYLAYVCGSEFVLSADFDVARRFVRFATAPPYQIVSPSFTPILRGDQPSVRQTDGHLLTISWDNSLLDIEAQVSLFNCITYRVLLCREFRSGLWRPIRSGHHYDIHDKIVRPLAGFPKSLAE